MEFSDILKQSLPLFFVGGVMGVLGMWSALGQIRQWQKNHDEVEKLHAETEKAHADTTSRDMKSLKHEIETIRIQMDGNKMLAQAISELAAAIRFLKNAGP